MGFNLVEFLVSQDSYGHPIGINYKGGDTY